MKKILVFLLITSILLSFLGCTTKQIEKYLEAKEHNQNVVFSDDHYVYFHNNKIEHDSHLHVENVTNQEIYYSALQNNNVIITKYDIKTKETTDVISFIGKRNSIVFYENWIEYDTVNGTKLYSLIENKEYNFSNELLIKEKLLYEYSDGYIKNNITNDTKRISLDDESKIFNTTEAKELKQLGAGFTLEMVKIYEEKICIVVGIDYFIDSVYLYDFETEEFAFLDWNKNTNGNVNVFLLD